MKACHAPSLWFTRHPWRRTAPATAALVRARSTPQALVFRCRIILRAAGTSPTTSKSPQSWIAIDTPSANGVNASWPTASPACKTLPAPDDPGAFPPDERLAVVTLASSKTDDHDQPATRWTLDDLAATIVNEAHHQAMSRATIWRILDAADLKPHHSVYWLNSHDPDFDTKAQAICQLYVNALRCTNKAGWSFAATRRPACKSSNASTPRNRSTGQAGETRVRVYPPWHPGLLITRSCVPTGEVVWDLGPTRPVQDFAAHLRHVPRSSPTRGFDWVVDNLNTHWSLDVCRPGGLVWLSVRAASSCRRASNDVPF